MLKRNLALAAFAIALVANLTVLAKDKNAWPSLQQDKEKATVKFELKGVATDPHREPHMIKARGGGMILLKSHPNPGGGHMKFNNHPGINLVQQDDRYKSSMKPDALKKAKPFKDDKYEKSQMKIK